jgi:hypothetical protein
MSNWDTQWFLVVRARERQQGFLREAERDRAVWDAQERQEPDARGFRFHAWITRILEARASKRGLKPRNDQPHPC